MTAWFRVWHFATNLTRMMLAAETEISRSRQMPHITTPLLCPMGGHPLDHARAALES
jgi:hypothetical protein